MEKENIIVRTQNRLEQLNLGDLKHYKESTQEQFITIEKYFFGIEEQLQNALKKIKSINLNIRSVCSAINISKSTVYNNPNTLRLYIEKCISDIDTKDPLSKKKQGRQQIRMSELEDFLDRTIIDQIEFNTLKAHNEQLQNEVNRLATKNDLLGLERTELVKKINDLELNLRKLRNKKRNVVSFSQEN